MTSDYAMWLKTNPAPDLQKLVEEYGGYQNIPHERHAQWDRDYADWHERYRNRHKQ